MSETLGDVNTLGCELINNLSTTIHNCHLIEKFFVKIESNQIKPTILKSKHETIKSFYYYYYYYFLRKR